MIQKYFPMVTSVRSSSVRRDRPLTAPSTPAPWRTPPLHHPQKNTPHGLRKGIPPWGISKEGGGGWGRSPLAGRKRGDWRMALRYPPGGDSWRHKAPQGRGYAKKGFARAATLIRRIDSRCALVALQPELASCSPSRERRGRYIPKRQPPPLGGGCGCGSRCCC